MILTQRQGLPSNIVLNTDPSLNPLNEILMILRILYLACAPKGTLIKINIDWFRIAFLRSLETPKYHEVITL